jgi:peroxiredoxin (alkyl hydroperoxide reductase subunit C)
MNFKYLIIMKKLFTTLFSLLFFAGISFSQKHIPLIGSTAPSFKANSTNGVLTFPDDFGESWKILFSHPQDFTPVCTTELLELAFLQPTFEKLGVKVAVISVDDIKQHQNWKRHLESIDFKGRGSQKVQFPLFEDPEAFHSIKYGMMHKPASTSKDVRGVYVLDSKNVVRSINFYPIEIGRNMAEIVRIVEALQASEEKYVSTPVNWNKGDDVLVTYRPFSKEQYKLNPEKYDAQYYSLDDMIWFRKAVKPTVLRVE